MGEAFTSISVLLVKTILNRESTAVYAYAAYRDETGSMQRTCLPSFSSTMETDGLAQEDTMTGKDEPSMWMMAFFMSVGSRKKENAEDGNLLSYILFLTPCFSSLGTLKVQQNVSIQYQPLSRSRNLLYKMIIRQFPLLKNPEPYCGYLSWLTSIPLLCWGTNLLLFLSKSLESDCALILD